MVGDWDGVLPGSPYYVYWYNYIDIWCIYIYNNIYIRIIQNIEGIGDTCFDLYKHGGIFNESTPNSGW